MSGAVGAVSEQIAIATAATNHNTRHPTVMAAYASTMHSLTGGRFTLGIGRGFDRMFDAMGLPHITTAQMEDFAGIMRRLWAGEMILGHDGPAGTWPYLNLDGSRALDIPLGLVAFGPNSLALGGARLRPGRAAHVLHRRDHRAVRAHGQGRGGAGRPRPRAGEGVVVLRHRRRPHRARPPAEEDGRAPRHLPPGLRRPARAHQRMGSRGARAVPGRRPRRQLPGRDRRQAPPPSSSSTSPR